MSKMNYAIHWQIALPALGIGHAIRISAAQSRKVINNKQNNIMPAITNKTILKHLTPIAQYLSAAGQPWSADAMAAVCIKVVLEHMGCLEQLKPEFQKDRADLILQLHLFFTAPVNFQRGYISQTNDENGNPLMQKPIASVQNNVAEFV
jgi:hypothetical protein